MTLIEAIKSGRPFRRKSWPKGWRCEYTTAFDSKSLPDFWILHDDGEFPSHLFAGTGKRETLLADDWEIQEPTVTITRTQFWEAARPWVSVLGILPYTEFGGRKLVDIERVPDLQQLAKRLGLEGAE